jgi:hypothetical protein
MAIADYKSSRTFTVSCSDSVLREVPAGSFVIDAGVMRTHSVTVASDQISVMAMLIGDRDERHRWHVVAIHTFDSLLPNEESISAKRLGERWGGADASCRDVPRILPEINALLSDGSVWHVPGGEHVVSIFAEQNRRHLLVHLAVSGHGAIEVLHPWATLLWKPIPLDPRLERLVPGKVRLLNVIKVGATISPAERKMTPVPIRDVEGSAPPMSFWPGSSGT